MSAAGPHPSRFRLDRLRLGIPGEDDLEVREHLESCPRCTDRVEHAEQARAALFVAHPSSSSITGSSRSDKDNVASQQPTPRWFSPRRLAAPLGALAAAACALLALHLFGPGMEERGTDGLRPKGGSTLKLAVKRGERSFILRDELLRAGDVLTLQVNTERPYLVAVGVEASGKVSIYYTDTEGKQSQRIRTGKTVTVGRGIELDNYEGAERLVVLLSDEPLLITQVREVAAASFARLAEEQRESIELGELPLNAEQRSWLLRRQR